MKSSIGTFLGSLLLLASFPSVAATVSVIPIDQSITIGSSFKVDLMVSGLIAGLAPSLSIFDLYLNFDPTLAECPRRLEVCPSQSIVPSVCYMTVSCLSRFPMSWIPTKKMPR
jgi:hypothetical protein